MPQFGNLSNGMVGNGAGGSTSSGDVATAGNGAGGMTSHGDKAGPKTPNETLTPKQVSAKASLMNTLNKWGLGSLANQIWSSVLQGVPKEQWMADIRSSDAYAQRFPGMAQLNKEGRAISESDYINAETSASSLMRAYGLPDGMANNRQELGSLIANGVSSSELQSRLEAYKSVVLQLPGQVKDYLQTNYGVHTGDLIGFWLDPTKSLPMIQQKVAAAEVGGAAALTGFGALDPQQAKQLAGLGVDWTHALAGFTQADQLKGLTQQLPGQHGATIGSKALVDATVGANGDAASELLKVQKQRKNQFGDQQSYATTQGGAVGLGVSDQP